MAIIEKQSPIDVVAPSHENDHLDPGYYDRIMNAELMVKNVSPFDIKTSIHNCFACDHKCYKKPVELSNFYASVMVIGETPSDIDFQTEEGKLLANTLEWAKFSLDDLYFTSLVKCEQSETPERCQHHLLSELLCVQPRLIIALGYDVGKVFDSSINGAGYSSNILGHYEMITTYRTRYTMGDQHLFRDLCSHIMQAKQRVDSKQ